MSVSPADVRIEISDLTVKQRSVAIVAVSRTFEMGVAVPRIEAIFRTIASGSAMLPLAGGYRDLSRGERRWAASLVLFFLLTFEEEESGQVDALYFYLSQKGAVLEVLTAWRLGFRPRLVKSGEVSC